LPWLCTPQHPRRSRRWKPKGEKGTKKTAVVQSTVEVVSKYDESGKNIKHFDSEKTIILFKSYGGAK